MSADGRAAASLGESTAEAVERRPAERSPPAPRASAPSSPVTAPSRPASRPSTASPCPRCAPSVSYVDGVTGGNVFLLPVEGARRLAAAMMGEEGSAEAPRAPSSPSSSSAPSARP